MVLLSAKEREKKKRQRSITRMIKRRASARRQRKEALGIINFKTMNTNSNARFLAGLQITSTPARPLKRKRIPSLRTEEDKKRFRLSERKYRQCLVETAHMIQQYVPSKVYTVTFEPNGVFSEHIGFNFQEKTTVFYLVGIRDYIQVPGIHASHATAVIRRGNKMYVFDPWGSDRLPPTTIMGSALAYQLNIPLANVRYYSGKNLQALDTKGVCVGLSTKMIIETQKIIQSGMNINHPNFNQRIQNFLSINANNPNKLFKNLTMFERGGRMSLPRQRSA